MIRTNIQTMHEHTDQNLDKLHLEWIDGRTPSMKLRLYFSMWVLIDNIHVWNKIMSREIKTSHLSIDGICYTDRKLGDDKIQIVNF